MTDHPTPSAPGARVLALPRDVIEHLLKIGPADWGATEAKSAEAHGADTVDSVLATAENFGQSGDQRMSGLYVAGTNTVICHTGTSPNSAETARILTGLWNFALEQAKAAGRTALSEAGHE